MVQKTGKFSRLQVTRLQIYYGVTQTWRPRCSLFEELQSFDLPMTRFPFLLRHKGLLIFEMKQPLFWKNGQICPSLDRMLLVATMSMMLSVETHNPAVKKKIWTRDKFSSVGVMDCGVIPSVMKKIREVISGSGRSAQK